jgi:hypothetical protein
MRNTALRIPNASADAPDSRDLGDMPKGLTGTLYRNRPNPQFARCDTHFHRCLDDGMARAAFGIEDGRRFAVSGLGDRALNGTEGLDFSRAFTVFRMPAPCGETNI